MLIGSMLLLAGVLILLQKLGIIHGEFWDYFWAILLISVGISMIFDRSRKKD